MATILRYDKGLLVPVEDQQCPLMSMAGKTGILKAGKRVGKITSSVIVINALLSLCWMLVEVLF